MKTALRPLNELGALVATGALRIGLARLGDCLPVERRWGVAYKRSKQERRQAALDILRQRAADTAEQRESYEFRRKLGIQARLNGVPTDAITDVSFNRLGVPYVAPNGSL